MDSTSPSTKPTGSGMVDWKKTAFVAGPVVTILLFVLFGTNFEQLLLGWLYFLLNTIPKMTIDRPSAIVGAICVLLFVVGLHRTACWWTTTGHRENDGESIRWTWRSTLVTSATLFVLFGSGTALVGASHQVIWLLSGRREANADSVAPAQLGPFAEARETARRTQARNNLKQFGLAFLNFHDTNGAFPPGGTINQDGELLHGWAILIGPYHSFNAPDLDYSLGWRVPPNDNIYKCQIQEFLNPSQPSAVFDAEGYGLCHWAGNEHVLPIRSIHIAASTSDDSEAGGTQQLSGQERGISISEITDGTINTILLGTASANFKPWGHPANVRDPAIGINRSPEGFGGPPGWNGAMFLMCDGSVGFLSDKTDLSVMKALATPAGGETIPDHVEF